MNEMDYVDMSLRQLRLRSGVALQTQGNALDAPKEEAYFLAAIDGKGVMISHEGRTTLSVGSEHRINGFTGQYDFQFTASVVQTFGAPVPYAMLTYPATVKARRVRQAARMKVSLPALVRGPGNAHPAPATILDLSLHGAMFHASAEVGGTGDAITIDIEFLFETEKARLTLDSSIRHCHRADSGGQHIGVSFRDVSTDDKLLLHYLAHSATQRDSA